MNPTPTLTLKQRILADEGPFIKTVQILCVFCVIAAAVLTKLNLGGTFIHEVLVIAGSTGYAITLLIADGVNAILKNGFSLPAVLEAADDATKAIETIKTVAAKPPVIDFTTAIKAAEANQATAPAVVLNLNTGPAAADQPGNDSKTT
jgi:hypothetical protein